MTELNCCFYDELSDRVLARILVMLHYAHTIVSDLLGLLLLLCSGWPINKYSYHTRTPIL